MADLNNNMGTFFTTLLTVILVSQTAVALGTFISVAAPSLNGALALSAPVMVGFLCFENIRKQIYKNFYNFYKN